MRSKFISKCMPLKQKNISEHDKKEFIRLFRKWLNSENKDYIAEKASLYKEYSEDYIRQVLNFRRNNDEIFNLAVKLALQNKKNHCRKIELVVET